MNQSTLYRQSPSGQTLQPSTPGYVLTVDADGVHVSPQPSSATGGAVVAVTVADTTPGFLASKLVAGAGLALTVVNPGADETLQLDILTAFAITAFGLTGSTLVLVGTTVNNPAFAAAYNQAATAVRLTDSQGGDDVIALPGTAFVSPHSFFSSAYGASVTFTDHATGPTGTGSATASASLVWGQNVYTGSIVDPGVYNSAFVTALAATLKLGAGGTYAENAGAGASVFFCALTAFGLTTANFFVGGFPFACSRVATGVAVVFNGVTAAFDVFRSDNVALGAFNLVVQ